MDRRTSPEYYVISRDTYVITRTGIGVIGIPYPCIRRYELIEVCYAVKSTYQELQLKMAGLRLLIVNVK